MYCVIQEIQKKKKNKDGYPKELKSEYMQMSINGQDESHYWHHYSEERFERDIKKAYRITIHESYRLQFRHSHILSTCMAPDFD